MYNFEEVENALKIENTKLLWCETTSNPRLDVVDIQVKNKINK